jgi:diguanylate cyclase (GGDEF)-like protein
MEHAQPIGDPQSAESPKTTLEEYTKKVSPEREEALSVLIAEDNPVSRRLLEKSLKKAGHHVVVAQNGREALDLFRQSFFSMVLTDWMMPEMNGIELVHAIRNHDSPGYVFIVFLTSKDAKDDIIAGLEAGADDYLTKPFHNAELMARLKTGIRILDLEKSLKQANEDIRILSITDPLTGTFNRGYLMNRLPEELNRATRYKHPLSLIMCDLDKFKQVNDSFGHLVGDAVLKHLSNCLNDNLRNGIDWISRYGGEEFLIVLSETDHGGALAVAERLKESLASSPCDVEEHVINVTGSFGVATFDASVQKDVSLEDLIGKADRYLYQAKKAGRNQVRGEY